MSKEIMQQALNALKYNQSNWYGKREAVAALEAELAKPEQPQTDLRKAAEMALDALVNPEYTSLKQRESVIDALRQELSKPEQAPVADSRLKVKLGRQYGSDLNGHWFYLQPADEFAEQALTKHSGISTPRKREWVSLTEVDLDEINGSPMRLEHSGLTEFAHAIGAKLREKNG